SPVPGTILLPQRTPPSSAPAPAPPAAPTVEPPAAPIESAPPPPAAPPSAAAPSAPITSAGIGTAQVIISPPGTTFRVGGGPYLVPLSIADAARVSAMTLTLVFDSTKLRVRAVQEGSFMRAG